MLFLTGGRCLWSLQVSGSTVTWTSTLVEMSTQQAVSFCLCCFSQVVRHLWSLHVSRIHCDTDLSYSSNVYPTSWFILSVLFLTGGGTSVFPKCVRVPHHTDLHPSKNVNQKSWFILSVLFLTVGEMSVVPTRVRDSLSRTPPLQ